MNKFVRKILVLGVFAAIAAMPIFSEAWYIVAGSFKAESNAKTLVANLTACGYDADIKKIDVKGVPYYRVFVIKPCKTFQDAEDIQAEFLSNSKVKKLNITGSWICRAEFKDAEEKAFGKKSAPASESVPATTSVEQPAKTPAVDEQMENKLNELEEKLNLLEKKIEQNEKRSEELTFREAQAALREEKVAERERNVARREAQVAEREASVSEAAANVEPVSSTVEPLPSTVEPVASSVEENPPVEEEAEPTVLTTNEESIPLSQELPYSLYINSYKEEALAENDRARLEKENIPSFVVKLFDEEEYFSFDLLAGAEDSEEKLSELEARLNQLGIKNVKPVSFDTYTERLQNYDKVISEKTVVFDEGNYSIPGILSDGVQALVNDFPINRDFQLSEVTIVDFDNYKKEGSPKPLGVIADSLFGPLSVEVQNGVHAGSVAVYQDSLFGKQVKTTILEADEGIFTDSLKLYLLQDIMEFKTPAGLVKAVLTIDENTNTLFLNGVNEKADMLILFETNDFTREEFSNFLNNIDNDANLLVYPQVRKSLLVLPEKNENVQRELQVFNLSLVDEDYAEEKRYADWAIPIVGHWNAIAYFDQEGDEMLVNFFDLDYDYNASRIYGYFTEDHNTEYYDEYSHASSLEGTDSWYVKVYDNHEVSFLYNNYIIAVDSTDNGEEKLLELARDLKIWK